MKKTDRVLAFLILLSVLPAPALAYDDKTTHPALTDEIVDFYNATIGQPNISEQEKEWIVEGSILEDTWPRWINHFYDPIYKTGWSGEGTGKINPALIQAFSKVAFSADGPYSAVEWVQNYLAQERFSRYGGNRSWKKALEYYAQGNKEEAYRTLGFILHLLEDMGVPEHTRNDTHAHELQAVTGDPGSPLEEWAKRINRSNFHIAADLKKAGLTPLKKATVAEYLESLANYSNKYFFSKDTINSPKYPLPKIVREDNEWGYSVDEQGNEFPSVKLDKEYDSIREQARIIISIPTEGIFFETIPAAYFSRLSKQIILHGAGIIDLFHKEAEEAVINKEYPIHIVRYDFSLLPIPLLSRDISLVGELIRIGNAGMRLFSQVASDLSNSLDKLANLAKNIWQSANSTSETITGETIEIPLSPQNTPNATSLKISQSEKETLSQQGDTSRSSQNKKAATAPAKNSNLSLRQTTRKTIDEEDEDAKERAMLESASRDSQRSTATPSTPEEANLQNLNLNVAEGQVEQNSAEQRQCSFADGDLPSHSGVILNEIAWMGTTVSANDEWIELKNISNTTIDISGWQLLDKEEQIRVTFPSGTKIPANDYFLLERTDDSSVPDVTADIIYSGALSNTNEGLRLFDRNCKLVDEALANPQWPAGDAASRLTMERDAAGFGWHTTTIYGGTPRRENSSPPSRSAGGGVAVSTPNTESGNNSNTPAANLQNTGEATHIVISEIYAGSPDNSAEEFIELYNPGSQAVDLSGWELRKRSASGAESNLVDSRAFVGIIPAKGYFLIASPSYSKTPSPDLRYSATSATIAYKQNTIVLYNGDSSKGAAIVDEVTYQDIQAGESIERKAFNSNSCVSAQGEGEYLGNGCDTDSTSDFEPRSSPKPQNSQSLPEPRSAPSLLNPSLSYSSSTLELVFNWGLSKDAAGATSTVRYELSEYNSPAQIIMNATGTQTFRKRIDEVGRDYHFYIQAFDAEGLGSATSALDITVPSFIKRISWYNDATATSTIRLEAWYDAYPFIPDVFGKRPAQTILVAYLNEEASKTPQALNTRDNMLQLATSTNPLTFRYPNCASSILQTPLLFLPDTAEWCSGTSGDMKLNSLPFAELEDPHLSVSAITTSPRTTQDFITLAFYSFSSSGGGNQGYSLVAVDKTKYYFQASPPQHEPPDAPKDLQVSASHDESEGVSFLTLSFLPSRDPDSRDNLLSYEWKEDTATSTWQPLTKTYGPDATRIYSTLTFRMGGDHTLLLRARDEDGNTSEEARGSISLPPSPSCPEKNGGPYYAIDCIKIADGLIKIRFRLLQSPGSIVFGIIPYLADKNPQASQALHKNINGNAAYPETTANGGVGFCNANITPIEQYELGRQYQRNFSSISGVSAQDIAPTSTLKFAIFQGTVCSINDAIFWNDPQEYKID